MTSPAPAATRMIGVDVARFLAIIGMIAAHLIPIAGMIAEPGSFDEAAGKFTDTLTAGIAAPLFAVLGGVSTVLATRKLLAAGRTGAAIGAVAIRGGLLILIGLTLGIIETPVAIVLAYYGIAMLLIAPLVWARSWLLALIALVLTVGGGWLNAVYREGADTPYEGGQVNFDSFAQDPFAALRTLLLTGEYSALTWCAYLLFGVLIGRLLTGSARRGGLGRAAALLTAVGAVFAVAGQLVSNAVVATLGGVTDPALDWVSAPDRAEYVTQSTFGAPLSTQLWAQLVATPHSGSLIDIVRTAGIAAAVIGALVLLCDVARARGGRATPAPGPLLATVRAAGAAPLTIYTLHIIATGVLLQPALDSPDAFTGAGFDWWVAGVGAFALQLAGVLGIGALLAALGRRGPLEALVSGIVKLGIREGSAGRV
ncbi:heparan-alpha-glucosaminide N-acetyltransferase domain-containing protein [Leucobacter chromiireducens]|uniref:heparan-alpha-glucosaminide N-acetyltransferase domain-containing protein n=1 Tax=Leucobacter chromiireducens TaxID=283877 RepID=UPI0013DE5D04|nr:heparan-alpha-glucosaminide N-acetyltransferase domain-containing protein [Leucobacter chromiireducens]